MSIDTTNLHLRSPLFSLLAVFFICGLAPMSALAQSYQVSGQIIDGQSSEPLISASVVAMSTQDSLIAGFAITDADGVFRIRDIKQSAIEIQVTYLGYDQTKEKISFTELLTELDMGEIKLYSRSEMLDGVTIEDERVPIQIKEDTIIYNADAFRTEENDNVEQLLRRMPGIEVEDDGSIKAQGEDVEQVLVDGKEFFGKDPKIATQNLPAKAVDKVQVYDQKSEIAEFSGIDDGERSKTINLELKEDYKKGYFGNLEAGYGTDARYQGKTNINRFDKKLQLSVLGNLNNVNEQGFSMDDYISFMGGMASFSRGGGRGFQNANINQGMSDGFINTASGGLNLNHEFSDKTELRSSYFINRIKSINDQYLEQENFLERGSFFNIDTSSQVSRNLNHRINLELRHEIDTTSDLRLRSSLTLSDTDVSSDALNQVIASNGALQNSSERLNSADRNNYTANANLLYRKKFGASQKRIVTLETSINQGASDRLQFTQSDNAFFGRDMMLEMTQLILQDQLQDNTDGNYSLQGSYTEPLGNGHYLDLKLRHQNYDTDVIQDVFDLVDGTREINELLSNAYHRDYVYNQLGTSWNINRERWSLTSTLAYQMADLDGELFTTDQIISKDFNNVLPSLNFRYQFAGVSNISLRYSTNVREPSLEQLQPLVDNSDPLNIYVGNPDLQAEYRHTLRIRYMNFDQFNFTNFFAFATATLTKNKILNQKFVDDRFVETTTPVNVDNDFNITSYINYGRPIRPLKIKMNIRANLGFNRALLFLNGAENINRRYTTGLDLELENREKDIIDITLRAGLDQTLSTFSASESSNQNFLNRNYGLNLAFTGLDDWYLSTSMDYRVFGDNGIGEDIRVPIWRASVSRYFWPGQRGELRLSVFDLLNQNTGISYTSNLNFTQYRRIDSLGRYFMLSFIYALKAFGGPDNGGNAKVIRMK